MVKSKGGEWSEAREGGGSGQKQGRGREWSEVREREGVVISKRGRENGEN